MTTKTAKSRPKTRTRSKATSKSALTKIKNELLQTTQLVKNLMGEQYEASLDNIKERSNLIKDNISDYAAEKPLQTLGIAMLAGFFISYLVRK